MGMKITSLKVKSAVVEEEQTSIQELQKKIDALTMVVKSSTMSWARPKQNNGGTMPQKTKDGRRNEGNGYKGRGLVTTSAGPFKPGQKLFQCYRCGGGVIAISIAPVRGHQLEDPKWGRGTSKPRQGSQPNEESINEGGNTEGAWGEGGSRYHNPDPLCRLIGPQNEVEVIMNDEQVTTLVDSGAQISTVCMAFVERHGLPIWQL